MKPKFVEVSAADDDLLSRFGLLARAPQIALFVNGRLDGLLPPGWAPPEGGQDWLQYFIREALPHANITITRQPRVLEVCG